MAAAAGDDALDLREHDSVIDCIGDGIVRQRTVRIHPQFRIHVEALSEGFLLGMDAMAREERAVFHPQDI